MMETIDEESIEQSYEISLNDQLLLLQMLFFPFLFARISRDTCCNNLNSYFQFLKDIECFFCRNFLKRLNYSHSVFYKNNISLYFIMFVVLLLRIICTDYPTVKLKVKEREREYSMMNNYLKLLVITVRYGNVNVR